MPARSQTFICSSMHKRACHVFPCGQKMTFAGEANHSPIFWRLEQSGRKGFPFYHLKMKTWLPGNILERSEMGRSKKASSCAALEEGNVFQEHQSTLAFGSLWSHSRAYCQWQGVKDCLKRLSQSVFKLLSTWHPIKILVQEKPLGRESVKGHQQTYLPLLGTRPPLMNCLTLRKFPL